MKYIKTALPFILGIPVGYILTLQIFSEIIPVLFGTQGIVYPLVLYSTLVFTILFFVVILQRIINGKISRLLFGCLMLAYLIILLASLFGRHAYESFLVLDPLTGFSDALSDREMLLQSVLNILIFIPAGYFFKSSSIPVTLSVGAGVHGYLRQLSIFSNWVSSIHSTACCTLSGYASADTFFERSRSIHKSFSHMIFPEVRSCKR